MKIENYQVITMPAGEYWIGDLCYVLGEEWDEVCSLLFEDRTDFGVNQGGFTLNDGRNFVNFSTAWGDGSYEDNYGRQYGVDSGGIGLIAVKDLRNGVGDGNVVTFGNAFECRTEGRGVLLFGHVRIETDA